ncbi:hypothetical protein E1B28_012289 [Marasmius oreades]|uniref:RlpA-like protein double-psi beta-barrel domain-containing protein n=1 Tax=Marasmius oreades TaxID=181124 RepID=A0A9P7UPS0_9AGAR|nr:uncharacterized protein E1B28_012289 [Marasmius oreades]KAG7088276.1 hypothetical protein E1B28_012289 [Marasmius oreades]
MASILTLVFIAFSSLMLISATPIPTYDAVLEKKAATHHGKGTWFHPGMGNCGNYNTDNDPIVAIGLDLYKQNGGNNCGQWVSITSNDKHAYGIIWDSCPGCNNNDLDMSPTLFQKFGPLDKGVLDIKWEFQPRGWSP